MSTAASARAARREPLAVTIELRACARLAAPLAAAQLATVCMGLTDTLMMGRLGEDALAAGALGTSCFSTLLVVSGGVLTAVAPLVAEARGRRDEPEAARTVRAACALAVVIGGVGTILLVVVGPLLRLLGQGPAAVAGATAYLRLVAPGFAPALLLAALRHALAAHGRSRIVLAVTAGGALLNALADMLLMRGALGIPGLGLAGIGAASAVVNWTMLAVVVRHARRAGLFGRGARCRARAIDAARVRRILRLGLPVAVMFGMEVGLFALTALNVGRHGSTWLAAHQIALQTTYVTYMVPHGISQAAAVRVAHWRGAGAPREARRAGFLAIGFGAAFMLAAAATLWVFPRAVIGIYVHVDDPQNASLAAVATELLAIAAASQVFDGVQVTAAGALRGLGDTGVPALVAAAAYAVVGAPLSFIGGSIAGARGCWVGLAIALVVASIGLSWRFARSTRRVAQQETRCHPTGGVARPPGPHRAARPGMGTACTFALIASVGLTGCAAEPPDDPGNEAQSAIQGGVVDVDDSGVVGVLRASAGGKLETCSGTLIAPNLVLTAQHCIADTDDSIQCASSEFGSLAPPEQLGVTNDASIWASSAAWHTVADVSAPDGRSVCGRDLALLILDGTLDARTFAPRFDRAVHADEPYSAVGYGVSGGQTNDAGLRRRRDGLEILCVGEACGTGEIGVDEFLGAQGGCRGDSGGPAIDLSGSVIGVTSRGGGACGLPIFGTIDDHADWIRGVARRAAQRGGYPVPAWAASSSGASGRAAWRLECAVAVVGGAGEARDPWVVAGVVGLAVLGCAARLRRGRADHAERSERGWPASARRCMLTSSLGRRLHAPREPH